MKFFSGIMLEIKHMNMNTLNRYISWTMIYMITFKRGMHARKDSRMDKELNNLSDVDDLVGVTNTPV